MRRQKRPIPHIIPIGISAPLELPCQNPPRLNPISKPLLLVHGQLHFHPPASSARSPARPHLFFGCKNNAKPAECSPFWHMRCGLHFFLMNRGISPLEGKYHARKKHPQTCRPR